MFNFVEISLLALLFFILSFFSFGVAMLFDLKYILSKAEGDDILSDIFAFF